MLIGQPYLYCAGLTCQKPEFRTKVLCEVHYKNGVYSIILLVYFFKTKNKQINFCLTFYAYVFNLDILDTITCMYSFRYNKTFTGKYKYI